MPSVLITGTSKGSGFECALVFGRAGYTVHATMRNPEASPELAAAAASEKLLIHVTAMDVDSDRSVADSIAAIERDHGPIDVLVNNAGVERIGSVEEVPLAEFRQVMETNTPQGVAGPRVPRSAGRVAVPRQRSGSGSASQPSSSVSRISGRSSCGKWPAPSITRQRYGPST